MDPQKREDTLEAQTKWLPIFYYASVIPITFIITVVIAAIFMGVFNFGLGGKATFVTSLAIVCFASVPGIIGGLLKILVIFLKDPAMLDLQHLLVTNAGAFLSEDAPKWLDVLLTSFDLFTFWSLILMAFGYSATNPKKISFSKAFTTITTIWLAFVLMIAGVVAAFT